MLKVIIYAIPHGDRSRTEEIGKATIVNDGTGDQFTGSYQCSFEYEGDGWWPGGIAVETKRHPRVLSAWYLLHDALEAALAEAGKEFLDCESAGERVATHAAESCTEYEGKEPE